MQELNRPLPPELEALKPVVSGIAATMGRWCEVVLHDFANPQSSLVAIEGNVTGRNVGAPMTERLLQVLRTHGDSAPDTLNVRTRSREGRLINSSTIFIRNRKGKIVGSLGLNLDLTELEIASRILTAHLGPVIEPETDSLAFASDVHDLVDGLLEAAIRQQERPVALLDREEKVALMRALDDRGYFLIRGSVEEVAKRLGISRFTVYSYLEEVRKGSPRSDSE